MRRQTTPFTPDTAAQVRCALDMLRTALSAHPDIDQLVDAAADWAEDVAASDASAVQVQQCQALANGMQTMFRLLDALDAGLNALIIADNDMQATFEWATDADTGPHAEFAATVEQAVRRALRKGVNA